MDIISISNDNEILIQYWDEGVFDQELSLSTGANPRFVSVGDPDNDGDWDILATSFGEDHVSFFQWNGIQHAAAVNLSVGSRPNCITTGDADNDGDLDILTTNSKDVSLIRWNGSGFDSEIRLTVAVPGNPFGVLTSTIGDVDSDGDQDLIVANSNIENASLFIWNGTWYRPEMS